MSTAALYFGQGILKIGDRLEEVTDVKITLERNIHCRSSSDLTPGTLSVSGVFSFVTIGGMPINTQNYISEGIARVREYGDTPNRIIVPAHLGKAFKEKLERECGPLTPIKPGDRRPEGDEFMGLPIRYDPQEDTVIVAGEHYDNYGLRRR